MTNQTATPIAVFSALLDNNSIDYIASIIPLDDFPKCLKMAENALCILLKKDPTPQDQKDVHEILQLIFEDKTSFELEEEYSLDSDDADAYMAVIDALYKI